MTATDLWKRVISDSDELACEGLFFKPPFCFWAHARNYLKVAYKLTNEEAEDVASTAMAKAFAARGSFKSTGKFEPWFWRVVNNAANDFLESWSQRHVVSMDYPSLVLVAAQRWQKTQENALVLQDLISISSLLRSELQVLVLMSEDISTAEIAETLAIDIDEVQSLRSGALKKLRLGLARLRSRRGRG